MFKWSDTYSINADDAYGDFNERDIDQLSRNGMFISVPPVI